MSTLTTTSGFWNPLMWLVMTAVMFAIAGLIYSFGNRKYKKGTEQTEPFLCGNDIAEKDVHVKASNIYWGFLESMKKYYKFLMGIHTGVVNDYAFWVLATFAILLLLFAGGAL
ncbi:MAG: hydrogenase [archaeon]